MVKCTIRGEIKLQSNFVVAKKKEARIDIRAVLIQYPMKNQT